MFAIYSLVLTFQLARELADELFLCFTQITECETKKSSGLSRKLEESVNLC